MDKKTLNNTNIMINQLIQVGAFMKKFRQQVNVAPIDTVSVSDAMLRVHLTEEENDEFKEALSVKDMNTFKVNKVAALDALADRLYVLLGDAHTFGLAYLLPVAFRMVHESNMSKLWTNKEVESLGETNNNCTVVDSGSARPYLVTSPFGKILKSPSYLPVDLRSLFDELEGQELLDFHHATRLVFGDAPEPDVDEPEEEDESNPF